MTQSSRPPERKGSVLIAIRTLTVSQLPQWSTCLRNKSVIRSRRAFHRCGCKTSLGEPPLVSFERTSFIALHRLDMILADDDFGDMSWMTGDSVIA